MRLDEEELSIMELAAFFKIPVYKLVQEMPYMEYVIWVEYFKERPQGRAEDYRAAMIMSAFNGKVPIEKIFPSLKPPQEPTNIAGIKSSVFFTKMQNAVGSSDAPEGFFN